MKLKQLLIVCAGITLLVCACQRSEPPATEDAAASEVAVSDTGSAAARRTGGSSMGRNAYFGDLHIHTFYSFDAFLFATKATPDDAYRYAKGEAIKHAAGFDVQLREPLDFAAVTDHGVFLGMMPMMADPTTELSKDPLSQMVTKAKTAEERGAAFRSLAQHYADGSLAKLLDENIVRSAWQDIIASAERHNAPGEFTTFIGYEYTAAPSSQNLHRNVIFKSGKAPELPFSSMDSMNPEDLWNWMDRQRAAGIESLAIPHNSNGSNGQMFKLVDWAGNPLDERYAETRMRNEPIVEMTQVKGTSDTHPLLSPNDEWADFEIMPFMISTRIKSDVPGSYVREAFLNGIKMADEGGFNPFRFGLIGSSDTHNAAISDDESNFFSKVGVLDATPQRRGSVPLDEPTPDGEKYSSTYYKYWGASGLAGVWADENSRESIYDAFQRKETFATTGPRLRLRFFAGYGFEDDLVNDPELVTKAYRKGVTMGGDLLSRKDAVPRFLVWAARDARSAPLQRLQVIKGWIDDGTPKEKVYDVACSDGQAVDPETHRCPDNGAKVNLADCSISKDVGASELRTLWSDPEFDPGQRAFYYVRALENPTCRWSTWDAVRAGVAPRADLQHTIQERAWSSPIWYVP